MKLITKRNVLIALALAVGVAGFVAFRNYRQKPQTTYYTGKVDRGDIRQVVEATGTINAVTTVQVGSQVSGAIKELNADFNSRVKKGQVIARIDPALFQGNLLQAQADLENARANLAAARANLEKAKATASQTKADYERTQALAKQGVFSQQQLDLARANAESGGAAVSAAQAQVTQAQAQVSQRSAAVQVAKTNLDHTVITAPIDGTVTARSVDIGQTVAASLQAPTLFTIAQDLTKMQVYAKTDESDIGQIRPGQPVTFKVDAFPRDPFRGRVVQVRMNPTTVQNVVTYDTIIEFENPDTKLLPGMTAYVTIPIATTDNTLRVPNAALRFRPDLEPEQLQALLDSHGIQAPATRTPRPASAGAATDAAQNVNSAAPSASQNANSAGGSANRRAGLNAQDETPGGGVPEGAARTQRRRADVAIIYKLDANKDLVPVQLRTGITDYTDTAILDVMKGDLKEGDEVVTGATPARQQGAAGTPPPGLGGTARPGRRR